jgi:polyphosphate:AMP phosphotransferase
MFIGTVDEDQWFASARTRSRISIRGYEPPRDRRSMPKTHLSRLAMFETAELGRKLSREDYEARVPELRARLVQTQYRMQRADFAAIIVVMGNDSIGRNDTIYHLHEWMDPRFLETHGFGDLSDEERERPRFWRYWRMLPAHGQIAIFYGSWVRRPLMDHIDRVIDDKTLEERIREINNFEKLHVDDGTLLLKFWLHLSEKAMRKQLKRRKKDPDLAQQINERDKYMLKQYERVARIGERFVRKTSTPQAPWLIIESDHARYRNTTVAETLLDALTNRIERYEAAQQSTASVSVPEPAVTASAPPRNVAGDGARSILDTVDLTKTMTREDYKKQFDAQIGRLSLLAQKAHDKGLTSMLVFEGWDAAGKGGAIRRLAKGLDPRDYRMISIASPTDEEAARHYLWRFWRHVPGRGRVRIFDRSWYGRVLVERIEEFATEAEWRRAYREINEFEEELVAHGILLRKFWIHIDADEQLRRFRAREATSFKRHKMSAEDWRNRAKWDEYERAVNEMVERTSTEFAPWHLIAGNNKRWARMEIIRTYIGALEERLG